MTRIQTTVLVVFSIILLGAGCHPTPAELLDEQRRNRDDSIANAIAANQAAAAFIENEPDTIHESMEIMEIDSMPMLSASSSDSSAQVSRLQQVLDVVTDTNLFE